MSMQCKVNNRLTPSEVRNMTLEEEDMKAVEDTKVVEEVEEHLAKVEDRSYATTVGNRFTLHETVR
jgi:hypothetical protein